jgi:hypothetical protein
MGAPNDPPRPLTEELAAAVPLALFSAAVAAGFARVFAGWQFLDNLLVLVIGGHGLSLLLRRARLPGIVALPIVAIALGWAIGAMHYRFTYSYLLPTSDTWNLFNSGPPAANVPPVRTILPSDGVATEWAWSPSDRSMVATPSSPKFLSM